jgi:hypothetical protein
VSGQGDRDGAVSLPTADVPLTRLANLELQRRYGPMADPDWCPCGEGISVAFFDCSRSNLKHYLAKLEHSKRVLRIYVHLKSCRINDP